MPNEYQTILDRVSEYRPHCAARVERIRALEIPADLPMYELFSSCRAIILKSWDYAAMLAADPELKGKTLDELAALNAAFYADMEPQNGYPNSIGNPDVNTRLYGPEMGGLAGAVYYNTYSLRMQLIKSNYLDAYTVIELFGVLYDLAASGNTDYAQWLAEFRRVTRTDMELRTEYLNWQRLSPDADTYRKIVETADLSDPRYLYRYGIHISEHDFAMADFINAYDAVELQKLADFIVQSWVDGFVRAKKDYRKKLYANVMIPAGLERLGRLIIAAVESLGLRAIVPLPHTVGINRQFAYDHRFDSALSMDREYVDTALATAEIVLEKMKDMISGQAGPVYVELFGETPFTPASKSTALKLSDEQQQLFREFSARNAQMYYRYYRRDEASFTIIAFPSPEIGPRFREIFADTLKINLLDSMRYARIQQNIIDVLDTAEYVHVKGKAGNDTDIMVAMHSLTDPEHQTLFENCVADVNIPVGEVFTSPKLSGTTGMLHVEDIYLGNLRYYNLRIEFEDGWIKDYSCTNFADPADARKYIHENLLLPHQTLPIGEFAIGTNTTAYQIAKKYDILSLLPILIIEKMGPHFAIGDTCFSHEEDASHPSFLNGKEMIAVENEKSATRHDDPVNAYTQKHMDITLPYEMLASIAAITASGERRDIIRDGRFVVPGTEELNIPLDEMNA